MIVDIHAESPRGGARDASLREMERGLDQLGMLGVSLTCSCFDRSTAEAEFEPLYAEMNRRRTVLNYHPIQHGICREATIRC